MIHPWRCGFKPFHGRALSEIAKKSFLIEEILVNAEVSCISSSSVFYWPENLLLLTNKLVYRSVENKKWSLENKKWSLENKKWLPLKLEATDHNWFPTVSLYSIPWITGSGFHTRSKNFKTPFFSRYQKFLSWGNSNGSKTTPNFFQKFFSTNMVARGVQSFCILEGATDLLIEQWLKFLCQFTPDMW